MKQFSLSIVCVVLCLGGAQAQTPAWNPSPGHTQIPIWPGAAPDGQKTSATETVMTTQSDHLVTGRPWST